MAISSLLLESRKDVIDRLVFPVSCGILLGHMRLIREGRAIPRMIFSEDVHTGDSQRKQRISRLILGYAGRLAEIIRRAQAEGKIRPEVDPQTAAMMFFGVIAPAGMLWQLTDGGFDVTKHAQRAWILFREAIAAKDRKVKRQSQGTAR